MKKRKTRKGGVSAIKKRIQREMQGEGRKKKKG